MLTMPCDSCPIDLLVDEKGARALIEYGLTLMAARPKPNWSNAGFGAQAAVNTLSVMDVITSVLRI